MENVLDVVGVDDAVIGNRSVLICIGTGEVLADVHPVHYDIVREVAGSRECRDRVLDDGAAPCLSALVARHHREGERWCREVPRHLVGLGVAW